MRIKLTQAAQDALYEWNMKTTGRGVIRTGYINNQEAIERLQQLALPNEEINDTIIRICSGNASTSTH